MIAEHRRGGIAGRGNHVSLADPEVGMSGKLEGTVRLAQRALHGQWARNLKKARGGARYQKL